MRSRVRVGVVALLAAVGAVAGCSFSAHVGDVGPSRARTPPSIVHDHHISLDFRRTPSRSDIGLGADQNWRSFEAAYHQVNQLTITLPTGVLKLPAHDVEGATDDAGGASDTDYSHQPKFFTVDALYPSDGAADAALAQQYAVLGIHRTGVAADVRLLYGSPTPRLSVTVQRESNLTASLAPGERYYFFEFDQYRNPAIDAVLHGGRMSLDLRHRPSRAELGFLDGYDEATIESAPPSKAPVELTVHTPHGVARLAVDSITSSSGGSGEPQLERQRAAPTRTQLTVVSTAAAAFAQLRHTASALGLTPPALTALIAGSPTRRTVRLAAPAYTLTVEVTADPARTDPFAASVTYVFSYL